MKIIVYTQRVEIVESYQERRDAADQRIPELLQECGYIPVPISNVIKNLEQWIEEIKPEGILLTGGNSLQKYGGSSSERDETDRRLIQIAEIEKIPLYGFCRGMQSILDYYGCELIDVSGHVAVEHKLMGEMLGIVTNSYHNQAAISVKDPLKILAYSEDGAIEAVSHQSLKMLGTMWHPERGRYQEHDIKRIRDLFN